MPKISVEGIEARNEAKKISKGYEERAELRAAIANLSADQTLRLSPSNGESTRKLKMMTGRAAKEINLDIKYEESVSGDLLVWLTTASTAGTGKRRGRPAGSGRKAKAGPEAQATLATPAEA